MAVTHPDESINAATAAVLDLLGEGAKLKLRTAGTLGTPGDAACTLLFGFPAFGDPVAGVATANAITPDSNATGQASAVATGTFETSGDDIIVHFAVTEASGDLDLSGGLTIAAGEVVSVLTSITYSALGA